MRGARRGSPTLQLVADRVLRTKPGRRALIGLDGVDGSGKTSFADALARHLQGRPVVVRHADDFLNPSEVRYAQGRWSPEGFWYDTYNCSALIVSALAPLKSSGTGVYRDRSYDPATDRTIHPEPLYAPLDAIVIVEGMFLHRDELAWYWDLSIFLDVPFVEAARRLAIRDGSQPVPGQESRRRYVDGQRIYFDVAQPRLRASIVIDNADFDRPTVVRLNRTPPNSR